MFGNWLEEITVITYINVFCVFILIGQVEKIYQRRLITNGFLIAGSLGLISILLFLSFEEFWIELSGGREYRPELMDAYPYWITFGLAIALLIWSGIKKSFLSLNVKSYGFIIVLLLVFISFQSPQLARILTNIILFAFGIFTIRDGAQQNRLSLLNYGLLILTALIICRFFDVDMSFVVRGLLFVAVGVGFFAANAWMVRKRKAELNSNV
jgi:hypothetical protein